MSLGEAPCARRGRRALLLQSAEELPEITGGRGAGAEAANKRCRALAEDPHFDLVLCDLNMPGIDVTWASTKWSKVLTPSCSIASFFLTERRAHPARPKVPGSPCSPACLTSRSAPTRCSRCSTPRRQPL